MRAPSSAIRKVPARATTWRSPNCAWATGSAAGQHTRRAGTSAKCIAAPRKFQQPRWHGEPLDGRRVLLHAEQGLGDTIQFCRYAALVAARGGVPVLQVQAPVERLMRSLAVVRAG